MINLQIIKSKSEELNIPFENLICGCIAEEVVAIISENNKQNFWLINDQDLGLDKYKNNKVLKLHYIYKPQVNEMIGQTTKALDDLLERISLGLEKSQISCHYNIENQSDAWLANFQIEFEKMYVPLKIKIRILSDLSLIPNERQLKLSLENNKSTIYFHYPIEDSVAESIYKILSKMELLNEMEEYLFLYDTLQEEALTGRKVLQKLQEIVDGKMEFTKERLDMLEGYQNYTYMKKKWKVLLRKAKRKEPTWEDVLEKDLAFIVPIYKSILEDQVFFGDWMPQLGRFLD